MKVKLISAVFLLSIFTACTSQEENKKPDASQGEDTPKTGSSACYMHTGKTDTILLKVIHEGEAITGNLVYKLDGKDKNQGTIQGSMKGDILVADYTFMSEGIQSVRQIAFKLKDNTFIEGYGETEVQNDKAHFKNLGTLKYNESMKLIEVECR